LNNIILSSQLFPSRMKSLSASIHSLPSFTHICYWGSSILAWLNF